MTFQAPLRIRTMGDADFRILVLPADVDATLRTQDCDRVIATLNDSLTWHAPLLSLGDDRGRYLVVSVEHRRQAGIADGDTVRVALEPDTSTYGMPVPVEWQTLLEEDAELRAYFAALSPGKQRRILYTVGKPRTEATRLRKAVGAAAYLLQAGDTKFTYEGLLEWLKTAGR